MKAYDFDCVVYDGGHYCVDCLPAGVSVESEDVAPVFATEEMDYYPTCCVCHERHEYVSLTPDGERYELELAGPQPEDITVTPTGPLCSLLCVAVVEGKVIGTYQEDHEADAAIREYMEEELYYPNVWTISDHGNCSLRKLG